MKYGGNTIASYTYDPVGNRSQIDYGNGTYTVFEYEESGNPQVPSDPRYRLEAITHYDADDEALATFGYTRDDVGNPLSISWRQNSTTYAWNYDYDAMNRLASAAPPEEGPLLPLPAQAGGTYSYDWVGNMKAAASSNPWQYNAADQLTVWPGMHSYEYDDNGALTAVKTPDGQTEQQTFTHHPTGLMNQATFNGQTLTNLWDADEHRVQFSIGEDDHTAVFDVTAGIPAVIKETTPQGTVYYVREPGGELICRVVTVGETTHKWFYHFDELGSTRLITDGSGAVTDRYSYDAYGAAISHDRNTGTIDQPYQYVGKLGYYTHYQAPEFGWLQLGVRFYEPETGRFERRDPADLADDASRYLYAVGAPAVGTDPTGRITSGVNGNELKRSCHGGRNRRGPPPPQRQTWYTNHELRFLECVAGCLSAPFTEVEKAFALATGAITTYCFARGKHIGWAQCAARIAGALREACRSFTLRRVAGQTCAVGLAFSVVGCEAKCYLEAW